ncbi:hypothetical protein AB0C98_29135 [Streptomyces sp. NPDC048558]|uniref:hypothetical protein n=1 Tax=Streptomyces sp. NPDC048558 TaxID=3155759 RepID=UPI00343FF0C5
MIATALVAGGVAGISSAASSAVQDSYQALCGAVRRKLSGGQDEMEDQQARVDVLDAYLTNPVGHHEDLVRAPPRRTPTATPAWPTPRGRSSC